MIVDGKLRIPVRSREFIHIPLKMREYHEEFFDNGLKTGSVTITLNTVTVALSKQVTEIEAKGMMAFDTNEKSFVGIDTDGNNLYAPMRNPTYACS